WSEARPLPVLTGLRDRIQQAPSSETVILIAITGPPTIDPAAPKMAYSHAAPFYIGVWTCWQDAAADALNLRWHREPGQALEPVAAGHYIGETDLLASPTRAQHTFAPGVWERVRAVQDEYDPHGVFERHIGQA